MRMIQARVETGPGWEPGVVIDLRHLPGFEATAEPRPVTRHGMRIAVGLLVVACGVAGLVASRQSSRVAYLKEELGKQRRDADRAETALAALARSHDAMLAATEKAPSVGTKGWGRRFTITKYLPNSPAYGKFNDGFTATMTKADPRARIVAVDPKLVPYGSWVWIEGLGWYRAEDCGSAIKGYRLDVLTATERDAMKYGKQDRFVIVVPPEDV